LWGEEPIKNLEKGGLSRTIRTDQSDELPLLYPKRDILKHPFFVIAEVN
jgi:hypothetical protein